MTPHPIGSSGLTAAPIMLGGNVFGWTADRKASFAVLDGFLAAGGSLIDTADIYSAWAPEHSGGESETMLGQWIHERKCRDKLLIATKVGMLDGVGGSGLAPSRIAAAVDESLLRLGVDVIDIYFAHCDDETVPLEESLAAFDALILTGKVRAIGASNFSVARLSEALEISKQNGLASFTFIQPRYNLVERIEYEGALQSLVMQHGLAVTPYFALASGYLTGKYRSQDDLRGSQRADWIKPVMNGNGPDVLKQMDQISEETGASHTSIALAWLMAQPGIAAPIASATRADQLEDIIAGASLTLSNDQLARLTSAIATFPAQ